MGREVERPVQDAGGWIALEGPFLKKLGSHESAEMALYWGRRLDVEDHELLYRSLRDGSFTQDRLLEWASLYGIRFHEAAGLDVVYDGEQRRVEMYEHLMLRVENAVFLGRVKVWDAETYRKAAIVGVPRLRSSPYLDEFLFVRSKAKREVKVPVTGPYTLMDWSYDEFYIARQNRWSGRPTRDPEGGESGKSPVRISAAL